MKYAHVNGTWNGVSAFQVMAGALAIGAVLVAAVAGVLGWLLTPALYVVAALFLITALIMAVVHFTAESHSRKVMRRFYRADTAQVVLNVKGTHNVVVMAGPQLVIATIEEPATKVGLVGNSYKILADGKPVGQADQHHVLKLAKRLTKLTNEVPVAVIAYPGMEGDALSVPLPRGGSLIICSEMDLAGVPSVCPAVITTDEAGELATALINDGLPAADASRRRKQGPKRKKRQKPRR